MNRKRVLVLLLVSVATFSLFAADYVFESYHLDLEVSESSVYTIEENIVANFSTADTVSFVRYLCGLARNV